MLIQLEYEPDCNALVADTYTHTVCVELFLRKIHTVQLSECLIQLEQPRDSTFACAIISANPHVKRFKILG